MIQGPLRNLNFLFFAKSISWVENAVGTRPTISARIVKNLPGPVASPESDVVLFNGLCATSELKTPDAASIFAGTSAMKAPKLAGHGMVLGKSGVAVHVAIMRSPHEKVDADFDAYSVKRVRASRISDGDRPLSAARHRQLSGIQVGFVSERSVRKLQLPLNRLKARLLAYEVQERVDP
jgi:hypothetical protein